MPPGAIIDYIRPSARAQYINPENDQDYSPFLSYLPRLDFDPTFANNFATRQDLNLGIDKVFNFDGEFNRIRRRPTARARRSGHSASALGGSGASAIQPLNPIRFFTTRPRHASFPSKWNASFSMPITRRWFDTISGVSQRNLTWELTSVVEYVIPGD